MKTPAVNCKAPIQTEHLYSVRLYCTGRPFHFTGTLQVMKTKHL
jgi:hypothetical protein